jgi:hypothetical protein
MPRTLTHTDYNNNTAIADATVDMLLLYVRSTHTRTHMHMRTHAHTHAHTHIHTGDYFTHRRTHTRTQTLTNPEEDAGRAKAKQTQANCWLSP